MGGLSGVQETWRNLAARERRVVVIGTAALSVMLVYALLWSPFVQSLEGARARVQAAVDAVTWMRSQAAEAKTLQAALGEGGKVALTGTLSAFIEEGARKGGLATVLKGVEPSGNDQVIVKLEQAPFHALVAWMIDLHAKGIDAVSASLERDKELGKVNARLVFARTGG
ncbi:MAG: type II secretion system protein M [Magnetococcales bacterium]|nr:type II secretion system protein M [Magnetococcales bacterium]